MIACTGIDLPEKFYGNLTFFFSFYIEIRQVNECYEAIFKVFLC